MSITLVGGTSPSLPQRVLSQSPFDCRPLNEKMGAAAAAALGSASQERVSNLAVTLDRQEEDDSCVCEFWEKLSQLKSDLPEAPCLNGLSLAEKAREIRNWLSNPAHRSILDATLASRLLIQYLKLPDATANALQPEKGIESLLEPPPEFSEQEEQQIARKLNAVPEIRFFTHNLRNLVLLATYCNAFEFVKKTAPQFGEVDARAIGWILRRAAISGHCGVAKAVIESPRFKETIKAHADEVGEALIIASNYGHLAIAQMIIENIQPEDISTYCLWRTLINSSKHGHLRIVRIILPKIREYDLGEALENASQYGHLAILEIIIVSPQFRNITPYYLKKALTAANARGHGDIRRAIIRKSQLEKIDEQCLGQSLVDALKNGDSDVARIIMQSSQSEKIKREYLSEALKYARKQAFWDIVNLIIESPQSKEIDEKELEESMICASEHNLYDTVAAIIENPQSGKFDSDNVFWMLIKVCHEHRAEIITTIIRKCPQLDETALRETLLWACKNGHDRIVRAILRGSRMIKSSDLAQAAISAFQNGYFNTAEIIKSSDQYRRTTLLERTAVNLAYLTAQCRRP